MRESLLLRVEEDFTREAAVERFKTDFCFPVWSERGRGFLFFGAEEERGGGEVLLTSRARCASILWSSGVDVVSV